MRLMLPIIPQMKNLAYQICRAIQEEEQTTIPEGGGMKATTRNKKLPLNSNNNVDNTGII